jgi:hypothetical protein
MNIHLTIIRNLIPYILFNRLQVSPHNHRTVISSRDVPEKRLFPNSRFSFSGGVVLQPPELTIARNWLPSALFQEHFSGDDPGQDFLAQ